MAFASLTYHRPFSSGPVKFQVVDYVLNSGATAGAVVSSMSSCKHLLFLGGQVINTAAPTFSTNTATVAVSVPTETAASKSIQSGFTVTAAANQGAAGDLITIAATGGGTAGSEVVTILGTAISVQIQSGTSTAGQIVTAINASAAASALVVASNNTTAQTITTFNATALAGGVWGGARGTLMLIGV